MFAQIVKLYKVQTFNSNCHFYLKNCIFLISLFDLILFISIKSMQKQSKLWSFTLDVHKTAFLFMWAILGQNKLRCDLGFNILLVKVATYCFEKCFWLYFQTSLEGNIPMFPGTCVSLLYMAQNEHLKKVLCSQVPMWSVNTYYVNF